MQHVNNVYEHPEYGEWDTHTFNGETVRSFKLRRMTIVVPKSESGKPAKTLRSYVKRRLDRIGVHPDKIIVDPPRFVHLVFFKWNPGDEETDRIIDACDTWVDRRTRQYKARSNQS